MMRFFHSSLTLLAYRKKKKRGTSFPRCIVHMLLPELHSFCNRPKNRPNNQAVREATQAMYSVLRAINNLSTKDRELLVELLSGIWNSPFSNVCG